MDQDRFNPTPFLIVLIAAMLIGGALITRTLHWVNVAQGAAQYW